MQVADIKPKMQSLDYRQYRNSYLIRSLLFSMTSGSLTSSLCTRTVLVSRADEGAAGAGATGDTRHAKLEMFARNYYLRRVITFPYCTALKVD